MVERWKDQGPLPYPQVQSRQTATLVHAAQVFRLTVRYDATDLRQGRGHLVVVESSIVCCCVGDPGRKVAGLQELHRCGEESPSIGGLQGYARRHSDAKHWQRAPGLHGARGLSAE